VSYVVEEIDPAATAPGLPGGERDPASVLATSTFNAGIELLPLELRGDARRLYCLLRSIDDLVDEEDPDAEWRVVAVERWVEERTAETPETRVLSELATRYPIPEEALSEFCAAMHHDLSKQAVADEGELRRYCEQAGGTVGVMLAALLGTVDPDGVELMALLGTAMQWTNILRDIDEDLAHGRVYVAAATIDRFGFPAPGQRAELLRDQIARVDELYEGGLGAIPLLRRGRRAMGLSAVLYREILREIERAGFGRRAGRVTVPIWRRRMLTAQHRWLRREAR
jgi:phytoene synthase